MNKTRVECAMNLNRIGHNIEKGLIIGTVLLVIFQAIFDFIVDLTGEPYIYLVIMVICLPRLEREIKKANFYWENPKAAKSIPALDRFADKCVEHIEKVTKWILKK